MYGLLLNYIYFKLSHVVGQLEKFKFTVITDTVAIKFLWIFLLT